MRSYRSHITWLVFLVSVLLTAACGKGKRVDLRQGAAPAGKTTRLVKTEISTFYVKSKRSAKCLAVAGDSHESGAAIVQQACRATPNQQWQAVSNPAGELRLVSVLSGLCLSADASKKDGGAIRQQKCSATDLNQLWGAPEAVAGGYVYMQTAQGSSCLDIEASSLKDGASIISWPCHMKSNQLWEQLESPVSVETRDIACEATPEVNVLWTTEWRVDNYGGNDWYSNFFTPLMHYKGNSYFAWINSDNRPFVSKISSDGKVTSQPLAASYQVRRNSHNLLSLGVDRDGYIHIAGDMQNGPNTPVDGSDRPKDAYPERYKGAGVLYWVSKSPESVEGGFEFAGDTSQAIPAMSTNGIRFFTDMTGLLYASATVDAIDYAHPGKRGIGLYKYDTEKRTWEALGKKPPKTRYSNSQPNTYPILFWEEGGVGENGFWQGFFSFFKFDNSNRLHFATTVNTDPQSEHDNRLVYAASIDGGYSWQKADGSPIADLPIRAADGVAGQGDLVDQTQGEYFFEWHTAVVADHEGNPGIAVRTSDGKDWVNRWYAWDGSRWRTDRAINEQGLVAKVGHSTPGGNMILTQHSEPERLYCQRTFDGALQHYDIDALKQYDRLTNIDEYGLRTTGVVYGVAIDEKAGKQSIVQITFR